MGKLRGIQLTTELRSTISTVLALPQSPLAMASSPTATVHTDVSNVHSNEGATTTTTTTSSFSPRAMTIASPSASLARAREAKTALSTPMGVDAARSLLEAVMARMDAKKQATVPVKRHASAKKKDTANDIDATTTTTAAAAVVEEAVEHLPLNGIQAIQTLINNSTKSSTDKKQLTKQLEVALCNKTTLSFQSTSFSNSINGTDDKQFQQRLARLRLLDEERSYLSLTTNLKNASSLKDDNVTAKSMMYATSVGLNMIVAPISFGVFMYFFAGSIFSRFFGGDDEDDRRSSSQGGTDIKSVIAGVISGVFMLFVEMILFVIRSHELDASVRKKAKRRENQANPFGYTKRSMERVYVRDD